MATIRLTVGQAVVRFLIAQMSERDGKSQRLIQGVFGIFGHGNVAGFGQALLESELDDPRLLPYYQGRNEQAMVHAAVAFAKMRDRLSTMVCTASVGPGSTNMVTGAAQATISRIPVLLLPSDTFATRSSDPVLQQLENFGAYDVTVNDSFRPVSRYFDRVSRPEQLATALLNAMRVLTDPVETGAVTIALPEDVQTQAYDFPEELFAERVWPIPRQRSDVGHLKAAAELISNAKAPIIVAGGGVIYSDATETLGLLAARTGIPVSETQAGKGSLPWDHPQNLGAIGATGTTTANEIARGADVVIGIGTRWSDFTTASHSAFHNSEVKFVNINVARFDATKLSGISVVGDAKVTLEELVELLGRYRVSPDYIETYQSKILKWKAIVDGALGAHKGSFPSQSQVIDTLNRSIAKKDVVVCAAGSLPGDLHKLWRSSDPKSYHVEYGFSCMGYEIAGGLGAKMAFPDREVYVMVGDGSYLMMAQELVTAVQEGIKINVIIVDNHGFSSIGSLSESVGSQRFGTEYRFRSTSGRLDGGELPIDLATNAESLGAKVFRTKSIEEFEQAIRDSRELKGPLAIYIETDRSVTAPSSDSWWDVPVAEVSHISSTDEARSGYEKTKEYQRNYLSPTN